MTPESLEVQRRQASAMERIAAALETIAGREPQSNWAQREAALALRGLHE